MRCCISVGEQRRSGGQIEEIGDKEMKAFDKGGVEELKHRQKKSLRKLALEMEVEIDKALWMKLGMIGFILSLLRRDQKELLPVEERRLKKAAFKKLVVTTVYIITSNNP